MWLPGEDRRRIVIRTGPRRMRLGPLRCHVVVVGLVALWVIVFLLMRLPATHPAAERSGTSELLTLPTRFAHPKTVSVAAQPISTELSTAKQGTSPEITVASSSSARLTAAPTSFTEERKALRQATMGASSDNDGETTDRDSFQLVINLDDVVNGSIVQLLCLRTSLPLRIVAVNETSAMFGRAAFLSSLFVVYRSASVPHFPFIFENYVYRTHLSHELDGRIVVDRPWIRGFERFRIERETGNPGLFHLITNNGWVVTSDGTATLQALAPAIAECSPFPECVGFRLRKWIRPPPALTVQPSLRSAPHPKIVVTLVGTARMLPSVRRRRLQAFVFAQWAKLELVSAIIICWDNSEAMTSFVAFQKTLSPDDLHLLEQKLHHTLMCEKHSEFKVPTYRGLFALAEQEDQRYNEAVGPATQRLIMMANTDVIFHSGELTATLAAVRDAFDAMPPDEIQHFLVTGRRRNCMPVITHMGTLSSSWLKAEQSCELFGEDAQDYFILTMRALQWQPGPDIEAVPALVVGGIAFDNWLVSKMNKMRDAVVFDASLSLRAFHLNHEGDEDTSSSADQKGIFASHKREASTYNSRIAHEHGGWSRGKVTLAAFVALPLIHPQTNKRLRVVIHERPLTMCRLPSSLTFGEVCYVHHFSQMLNHTEPPDAFSRPWQRPD